MGTIIMPYLKLGQPIDDWGKEFIGACASAQINDENALKILPQFAARDIGTKEYAYVACENNNDPKDNKLRQQVKAKPLRHTVKAIVKGVSSGKA